MRLVDIIFVVAGLILEELLDFILITECIIIFKLLIIVKVRAVRFEKVEYYQHD